MSVQNKKAIAAKKSTRSKTQKTDDLEIVPSWKTFGVNLITCKDYKLSALAAMLINAEKGTEAAIPNSPYAVEWQAFETMLFEAIIKGELQLLSGQTPNLNDRSEVLSYEVSAFEIAKYLTKQGINVTLIDPALPTTIDLGGCIVISTDTVDAYLNEARDCIEFNEPTKATLKFKIANVTVEEFVIRAAIAEALLEEPNKTIPEADDGIEKQIRFYANLKKSLNSWCKDSIPEAARARELKLLWPGTTTPFSDFDEQSLRYAEMPISKLNAFANGLKNWLSCEVFENGCPQSPKTHIYRQRAQEKFIFAEIKRLGYDPKKLPKNQGTKPGVKSAIWKEAEKQNKIFSTRGVFDKAWERCDIKYEI